MTDEGKGGPAGRAGTRKAPWLPVVLLGAAVLVPFGLGIGFGTLDFRTALLAAAGLLLVFGDARAMDRLTAARRPLLRRETARGVGLAIGAVMIAGPLVLFALIVYFIDQYAKR